MFKIQDFSSLELMRNHEPFKGHGTDHYGVASVANIIVAFWIESSWEDIKKSLEKII